MSAHIVSLPCIYNGIEGIRYCNDSDFECYDKIRKLIVSLQGLMKPYDDRKAKYGLTNQSIGITNNENLFDEYYKFLKNLSDKYRFDSAIVWSGWQIPWVLFKYLKEDFYRYV